MNEPLTAAERIAWWCVIAVALALTALFARVALAQESAGVAPLGRSSASSASVLVDDAGATPVDVLPIALALEHTWQPEQPLPLREWAGILHVLRKRSERAGVTVDALALAYVSGLRAPSSVPPASRWKLHLSPTCEQPAEWPAHLAWEAWRPGCVELHAFVERFVRGEVADPHPRARHWGGSRLARDHARCVAMGVVAIGKTMFCGEGRAAVPAQLAKGGE